MITTRILRSSSSIKFSGAGPKANTVYYLEVEWSVLASFVLLLLYVSKRNSGGSNVGCFYALTGVLMELFCHSKLTLSTKLQSLYFQTILYL